MKKISALVLVGSIVCLSSAFAQPNTTTTNTSTTTTSTSSSSSSVGAKIKAFFVAVEQDIVAVAEDIESHINITAFLNAFSQHGLTLLQSEQADITNLAVAVANQIAAIKAANPGSNAINIVIDAEELLAAIPTDTSLVGKIFLDFGTFFSAMRAAEGTTTNTTAAAIASVGSTLTSTTTVGNLDNAVEGLHSLRGALVSMSAKLDKQIVAGSGHEAAAAAPATAATATATATAASIATNDTTTPAHEDL